MGLRQLVRSAFPEYPSADSLPDVPVSGIECDSRKVEKGFVFIAVRGAKLDGSAFIEEAARRGASAVVAEPGSAPSGLPLIAVPDSRSAVARLASVFYGEPSKKMKVAGVTGTNGKTTVTYLVEYLLQKKRKKTGVIGTVSYRYDGTELPAVETTPGPLKLQEIFSRMAGAGCENAVMEVSSHALDQGRVNGITFACAAFTNLTQDHLDYHGSMEAYFQSKAKLFAGLTADTAAVVNLDDEWGRKIPALTKARLVGYGIDCDADLRAVNLEPKGDSTAYELQWKCGSGSFLLPLIGRHNVYNALAALGICAEFGIPPQEGARLLADFPGVPGRLEALRCGQDFSVLVDFAHTPDGLENVLRALSDHRSGRLIVVFGCGGDRDRTKRPKMAAIAAQLADHVVLTSDNPRSEDPRAILEEVRAGFPEGFKEYAVVPDRAKAIRQALLGARAGDIVLLAGKGHERSQILKDRTVPFSDREEAERVLNGR